MLLDLASETFFSLYEVGTHIWQLLQKHRSLRDVYELLLWTEYVDKQMESQGRRYGF